MAYAGKSVLVTGSATGIGRGIARGFLEEGATVLINDVRPAALDSARDELRAEFGDRVLAKLADVRDAAQVRAMFDALQGATGRLDVVVSNAGIYPDCPVVEMEEELWDRVLDTNAKGNFLVCREAARRLIAQGAGGNIIAISSGSARSGRVNASAYCASKAAVTLFSEVLSTELAPHQIRVNIINPGFVDTQSEVSPIAAWRLKAARDTTPGGRLVEPRDVASAALFLASDRAECTNGMTFSVTGIRGVARLG
ncbi:MAG TPA: SDR family NAD(P)-dependent oxidoreductase [Thermomicrobiales bacterium]|nr:SDR family NAD(P)-dependent oxidoreductase [Thermomicrobiales bacterium]